MDFSRLMSSNDGKAQPTISEESLRERAPLFIFREMGGIGGREGGRRERARGLKGRGVTDLTDSGGGGSDGSRCGDGWESHSLIKARRRLAEQEIMDLYK